MHDFLFETAQRVINEQKEELENTVIILPNRRAALFLKKHFGSLINGPIWSPKIISAEEFLEDLSDSNVLDNVQLLFEFYAVYKQVIPFEEQNSFDQFIQWGNTLLQDFNEIDRYLIDPKKLFEYVNEARALEVWNLEIGKITEVQQNYLSFWRQMETLYHAFRSHLETQQLAYSGLSYRKAAEGLTDEKIQRSPYHHIYFAGFNALTAAEQLIMERFVMAKKATMLFDADEYYVKDELHEAGFFMRQLEKKPHFETSFKALSQHFKASKKISIYAVPKNVGQAKLAGKLLKEASSANNYRDTAVVLADENLLLPVLQSLPDEVDKVNITMGYPISNSPIYTFFERYIHLHQKAELNAEQRGSVGFYYKDVINLLEHPFLPSVSVDFTASAITAAKSKIEDNNLIYLSVEELVSYLPLMSSIGIKRAEELNVNFLIKKLLSIIEKGKNSYSETKKETSDNLAVEYLFHLAKILNQILELQQRFNNIEKLSTFYIIFKQLCRQTTIPFFGEPLSGLQLLGVLETRTIDFKNLIILTVNEGVLPSGKSQNSFIPYDIKRQFNLPTHKEKDAIYAYHFYRLIQRAEQVTLVYNSSSDKMGGGERSRFIEQLVNELPNYNSNIEIEEKVVQTPLPAKNAMDISIDCTEDINEAIQKHLNRGISPSAINTFTSCPLEYYYKYILGLKEPKETEENIAATSFGNIIHESLDFAYKPHLGKTISKAHVTDLKKNAKAHCQKKFFEKYGRKSLSVGKNYLIYTVAQSYLDAFFEEEAKLLEDNLLRIIQLESELEVSFSFDYQGKPIVVKLKGKVDRIDEVNNHIRVIDYKTGVVDDKKLKLTESIEEMDLAASGQAIQLLIYAYCYAKTAGLNQLPEAGILSFRKIKSGLSKLHFDKKFPLENRIEAVEELLSRIFTNMLDVHVFEHRIESKFCKFCQT